MTTMIFKGKEYVANFHPAHHERGRGYRKYLCNCMPNIYLRLSKKVVIPHCQKGRLRHNLSRGYNWRCPGFKYR